MGSEILSSTGAGVWRKAPKGFPDSSSVLEKFQSANHTPKETPTQFENGECDSLSDPTETPPYRETGVAIPLSHCVLLWYRRLSLLHTSFRKDRLSQAKVRPNKP